MGQIIRLESVNDDYCTLGVLTARNGARRARCGGGDEGAELFLTQMLMEATFEAKLLLGAKKSEEILREAIDTICRYDPSRDEEYP